MATYTQANQPIEIVTPLGKDALLITGFQGEEGISRLFHFHVDMIAEAKKDVAFDQILGQKVSLRLNVGSKPRYFSGICIRFSQGEADTDFCAYQMEMAPAFWLFSKVARTRTFQQQAIPDILKAVLTGLDVTYQLSSTYPRNYCVQYRETDFNFACRLMEEEGIFYFFTHTSDGHKMVVADSNSSHPDMPLNNKLLFEKNIEANWAEDRILTWQKQQELLTGNFTLWDHCFEMTGKNLQAKATINDPAQVGKVKHSLKAGNAANREVYDYPGEYAVRFDGVDPGGGDRTGDYQKILKDNERTVGIRQQQEATRGLNIHGTSTCRNLVSGHKFTLQKHANGEGDYVLTSIHHQVTAAIDYRSAKSDFQYINSFTAIPYAVPYRPQRLTPKPFVQGTQTATVVGPSGQEIFTDKYGRVKVQFNWDREGNKDAKSSCWVRVSQIWAGNRWGASFWPRIGQEVVVAFIEGNPDAPIIVGSVYNNEQMPPYLGDGPDSKHPKDNKVSGVKSNSTPDGSGYNEWRFDDSKGKEQVFIHAERNLDVRVKNDAIERVIGNSNAIVGYEKDGKKGGDQKEKVYQDKHLHILRNQEEQIEGNLHLTVGKGDAGDDGGHLHILVEKHRHATIEGQEQLHVKDLVGILADKDVHESVKGSVFKSVGADSHLSVTGAVNEKIGGDHSSNVSGKFQHKAGGNFAIDGGGEIHIKAGTKLILEAGTQLSLVVGGNFIDIGSSGVSIVGSQVNINSGGSAGSGSGCSPTDPTAPNEPKDAIKATPADPAMADDSASGAKSAPG
jgi:type VI secretion system secreted protein VgrG